MNTERPGSGPLRLSTHMLVRVFGAMAIIGVGSFALLEQLPAPQPAPTAPQP